MPMNSKVRKRRKLSLTTALSQFEKKDARLASFKNWPAELKMRPEELADAGFFHHPDDHHADQVAVIELQDHISPGPLLPL